MKKDITDVALLQSGQLWFYEDWGIMLIVDQLSGSSELFRCHFVAHVDQHLCPTGIYTIEKANLTTAWQLVS